MPRAQRAMLRSSRHGLAPLWQRLYLLSARAYAAYVRHGARDAAVYLTGSLTGTEHSHGLSDIDIAVVVPVDRRGKGLARERARRRCERVARALGGLGGLVFDWPIVLEEDDLRDATRSSTLTYRVGEHELESRHAVYAGPYSDPDRTRLLERPWREPSVARWRRLAGPERRPASAEPQAAEHDLAGWLELQYWWWWAFEAASHPQRPSSARLCVKLVGEAARIWLSLVHDARIHRWPEALDEAARALPEEAPALAAIRDLHAHLSRLPEAPLGEALALLTRFSLGIAEALDRRAAEAGFEEVALLGEPDALWLPHGDWWTARGLPRSEEGPRLLPLLDWRAIVCAEEPPDETFALCEGEPTDPGCLASLATGWDKGPYPTLRLERLLLRPSLGGRRRLRTVQCESTDPVSFALVGGERRARFPELPGLSLAHVLERARREAAVWLSDTEPAEQSLRTLGRLILAARAGLAWEAAREGEPALTLNAQATIATIGERAPALAEELGARYAQLHISWARPSKRLLRALRSWVTRLPAFGERRRAGAPHRRAGALRG